MPGAATWPGCKQVFRCRDDDGVIVHDTLGLQKEAVPGTPLLEPVLRSGERVCPCWSLAHVRQALRTHVASLPAALRGLSPAPPLPVLVSPDLRELARQVDRRIA
jgi:nicotinate phosphoribosyltransferase